MNALELGERDDSTDIDEAGTIEEQIQYVGEH
jgi:hypothetical protein